MHMHGQMLLRIEEETQSENIHQCWHNIVVLILQR
jgi:hypothetical protein